VEFIAGARWAAEKERLKTRGYYEKYREWERLGKELGLFMKSGRKKEMKILKTVIEEPR
jgi:hypothetical protein